MTTMRENLRLFALQLLLHLLMAVHRLLQAGMNWTWGASQEARCAALRAARRAGNKRAYQRIEQMGEDQCA